MRAGWGWSVGLIVEMFPPVISDLKIRVIIININIGKSVTNVLHIFSEEEPFWQTLERTQWQWNRQRHCCPCPLVPVTLQTSRAALAWYRSSSFAYFPGMMLPSCNYFEVDRLKEFSVAVTTFPTVPARIVVFWFGKHSLTDLLSVSRSSEENRWLRSKIGCCSHRLAWFDFMFDTNSTHYRVQYTILPMM